MLNTAHLPKDTKVILFSEIPGLMADAKFPGGRSPESANYDNWFSSKTWSLNALQVDAGNGKLTVRNKFNGAPIELSGDKLALLEVCEVTVNDLKLYLAECGITLVVGQQIDALPEANDPAPTVEAETTKQRRARWLDWYGKGERGAVQSVYERELLINPKADRSFIGKEIKKAKQEKKKANQGGDMYSQLVKDGRRVI